MATLDQVWALLVTVNRKADTLLQEAGIIMSQGDDLSAEMTADTQLLLDAAGRLNDNYTRLAGLVAQLEAGQGQPVSASVLSGFREALGDLKPAVDKVASIGQPPAPGPVGS